MLEQKIDYCDAVREREEKIKKYIFEVNGITYSAEIAWPGTCPVICMKDGESVEPLLFIIHSEKVFIGGPETDISSNLRTQLVNILDGKKI